MTNMSTYFRDYFAYAAKMDEGLERLRRATVGAAQVMERSAEEAASLIKAAKWDRFVDAVGLPFAEALQRGLDDYNMATNYYAFRCNVLTVRTFPDSPMIAPS